MELATTATAKHGTTYLWQPLTADEIRKQIAETDMVKGCVAISVDDMIEYDLEGFNDLVSEALIDSYCLQEISFKPVDVDEYTVIFEVTGYVDESDLDYL